MKFYKLTHPKYKTDRESSQENSVKLIVDYYIPGIICDACSTETGGGWASSDRIRVFLPGKMAILKYLDGQSLGIEEWENISLELSKNLGISKNIITPGAQIGPPKIELLNENFGDFIHPFPGQVIVVDAVKELIKKEELSGVDFFPVEVTLNQTLKKHINSIPLLWELVITGHAWRKKIDLSSITVCKRCFRTNFPNPNTIDIDIYRWDKTDFFNVDKNPNIIIVTEKTAALFAKKDFSNFLCEPLSE